MCWVSLTRCVSTLLFNEAVCVGLFWPCQMAWWTAWIQTAVCRQPVTPLLCVLAPRIHWTSSRRRRCPLHKATCRLSMTECVSWWAGTAPTSSPEWTPSMASEWHAVLSPVTPPNGNECFHSLASSSFIHQIVVTLDSLVLSVKLEPIYFSCYMVSSWFLPSFSAITKALWFGPDCIKRI